MHLEGANIESMKEWYQDRLLAINTNITTCRMLKTGDERKTDGSKVKVATQLR